MLSGGIRYGHEWIWHLVKLVNAGSGVLDWDDIGMPVGCQWDDQTRRRDGSQTVRSSGGEPSQSQWRWWRNLMIWRSSGDCYRGIIKIKIIFYNMKCKDVLDKKLPVAGENEIAWHELRWDVRLLSIAVAAWWEKIIIFYNMKCKDIGGWDDITRRGKILVRRICWDALSDREILN
jgi:hypothetical protein